MDELYGDFKTFIFIYHIFREANRYVDSLASFGYYKSRLFLVERCSSLYFIWFL